MKFNYTVVPFMGSIGSGQSVADVAKQLDELIAKYVAAGWEFYQLGEVRIHVSQGCLAGFFGAGDSYMSYNQVIFRAPQKPGTTA